MTLAPIIGGFLFNNYLWLCFIIDAVTIAMSTVLIIFFVDEKSYLIQKQTKSQEITEEQQNQEGNPKKSAAINSTQSAFIRMVLLATGYTRTTKTNRATISYKA